jgi:MFS family permease
MGSAPTLELLLLGRVLYGLGIGFAMHAAPAFIAEAAPAKVRGLLIRHALVSCFFWLLLTCARGTALWCAKPPLCRIHNFFA